MDPQLDSLYAYFTGVEGGSLKHLDYVGLIFQEYDPLLDEGPDSDEIYGAGLLEDVAEVDQMVDKVVEEVSADPQSKELTYEAMIVPISTNTQTDLKTAISSIIF